MATTFPTYPATTFEQAVELSIFASTQLHNIINGDATTTIETENGDIPSVRKALVDNFYFKTPIKWVSGTTSTEFNQLYYFYDSEVLNGWYYAPSATTDNPVALGSTPSGDDNWVLYTPVSQAIPTQVYPWYVEVTQQQTTISPPYTFDTAIVVYNGVVLTATKDYTITDSVITFTSPLEVETDSEYPDILFCYLGKVEEGDPDTNYVTYLNLTKNTAAGLIGTTSGKTLQEVFDVQNKKIFFSNLVADSTEDQTELFQSEVNSLESGMIYITPTGTIISQMVIIPSLTNVDFYFKGTKFKRPDNVDPTDTDQIRFNRINNCKCYGLYVDGNRDNLPVTGSDSTNLYGRVLGWRIGNNSSMCYFEDVTMVDQLYCGSQWGKNITNITITGVTYDNIGEHVFYISGKGGGSNKHIVIEDVKGGSLGINSNNVAESHTCGLIKSAQSDSTGVAVAGNDNDDFILRRVVMDQSVTPGYAAVAVINGYLNNLEIDDLVVGANIGGILSPLGRANNVKLNNIRGSSSTVGCPLVWSYPTDVTAIDSWKASNIYLLGSYNQPHIQLFSLIENFIIPRFTSSADQANTVFSSNKRTIFRNGTINSAAAASLLQYVARDFIFDKVVFSTTVSGTSAPVDYIGQNSYTSGATVWFDGCKWNSSGNYSVGTYNDLSNIRITNSIGPLKQIYCRASTALAKLTLSSVEMSSSSQPPVVSSKISVKSLKNVVTSDGLRDLAEYRGSWTITTGLTSIGYDLTNVLIGAVDPKSIQITPRTNLYGATKFWVTVSGNTVTINTDIAATASMTFNILVQAGTQES